jgi:putative hydrolase of the HAD superfamily
MINHGSGIIFDGDDTLWETEPLYDRARHDAGTIVASETGSTVGEFESTQRAVDLERVKSEGLSADRFPTSSVLAYQEIAGRYSKEFDRSVAQKVLSASKSVYFMTAPLVPFAHEVLSLVSRHLPCALLTRGDVGVQTRRFEESGLEKYFSMFRVVDEKNSEEYLALLSAMNCDANASWAIGNSIPSDIIPAVEANMNAIWIDSHVWDYERRVSFAGIDRDRVFELHSLSLVPNLLDERGVLNEIQEAGARTKD